MKIRTRFSPSPTGKIHLGNARAALFSALFAKKRNGVFILRIEDTDATRSQANFVDLMQEDLLWLGVKWQEGPDVGGEYGPYQQSQRQAIYEKYYQILAERQLIYPCFCTDKELALSRKLYLSRGHAPRYSGHCRTLDQGTIDAKLAAGLKPAWRFKVPEQQIVEFEDCVKGLQQFNTEDIGDFIVRRADGTAPFLFCNAIDDAMMKVSHVLRGEDHVANTPRQILILQALKLSIPTYGHLSLILGEDGTPLSKRHGSFSLHDIRNDGFLAKAIMNYLARLGHTLESNKLLDFNQLADLFNIEKLSRSPARFDMNQLLYWQKVAVQQLSHISLAEWLGEKVMETVPEDKHMLFLETIAANVTFPRDALLWSEIFFSDELQYGENEKQLLQAAGEQFFVEAEEAVQEFGVDLAAILNEMKKRLALTGKKLFMPLRVALTGKQHGPELLHIAALLGKEKMQKRLSDAFKLASRKPKRHA